MSAPAKLLLVGEYAVLEGAPAIVVAVDRRVRAAVDVDEDAGPWVLATDTPPSSWRLRPDGAGALRLDDGRPAAEEPATRLLAVVVEHLARRVGKDPARWPSVEVRLESRRLASDDGGKLGLGSSAALAVALRAAVSRLLHLWFGAPGPDADASLLESLAVHRAFQGGRGSGADVAASERGGVLRFVRANGGETEVRRLPFPDGLHWTAVHTGSSARTVSYLVALERARRERPEEVSAALGRLAVLAEAAADAFESGPRGTFLDLVPAYVEGLDRLGGTIGLEIVSPPHRALAGLAEAAGAVYKPSGAGGGDVGLIFGPSETCVARAAAAADAEGFRVLELDLDPVGARFRGE